MAERWEFMVRSRVVALDRTIETPPMDEETARLIAGDTEPEGFERTLLRRRKAGPWEEADHAPQA